VRHIPVATTYVVLIAAAAVILLGAHRTLLRKTADPVVVPATAAPQ
jgi:hypothetical protein